jgi:hypothetical protein
MLPSLAVDLRVLEFAMNLFLQISPNNTAFSLTLERVLGNMGFQLGHQVSLVFLVPNRYAKSCTELFATAIRELPYVVLASLKPLEASLQRHHRHDA